MRKYLHCILRQKVSDNPSEDQNGRLYHVTTSVFGSGSQGICTLPDPYPEFGSRLRILRKYKKRGKKKKN